MGTAGHMTARGDKPALLMTIRAQDVGTCPSPTTMATPVMNLTQHSNQVCVNTALCVFLTVAKLQDGASCEPCPTFARTRSGSLVRLQARLAPSPQLCGACGGGGCHPWPEKRLESLPSGSHADCESADPPNDESHCPFQKHAQAREPRRDAVMHLHGLRACSCSRAEEHRDRA